MSYQNKIAKRNPFRQPNRSITNTITLIAPQPVHRTHRGERKQENEIRAMEFCMCEVNERKLVRRRVGFRVRQRQYAPKIIFPSPYRNIEEFESQITI